MVNYLLEILKENKTIIIPGLGALTITNSETGDIMFMPYLRHDNGVLSGFIAQKDGIDEADAKNIIAKFVREINAELDKGETFSMFQLGDFVKTPDGDIEFAHWSSTSNSTSSDDVVMPESPTIIAGEPPLGEEMEEEQLVEEETQEEEPEIHEIVEETSEEITPTEDPTPTVFEMSSDSQEEEQEMETPDNDEDTDVSHEVESDPEPIADPTPASSEPAFEIHVPPAEEEMEATDSTDGFNHEFETNTDPIIDPLPPISETTSEPEINLTEEEIKIKHVIEEAFEEDPNVEVETSANFDSPIASAEPKFYEESTPPPYSETFEPSAEYRETEEHAPMTDEEKAEAGEIVEDEKKKDKGGVGFWITLIVLALLIIGGGAYIGRNYNELKQYVPFLADEEVEKPEEKSLKEEMYETIHGAKENEANEEEITALQKEMEEMLGEDNSTPKSEPEVVEKPKVTEKPKAVEKPKVTAPAVSSSSSGPYKVIAGAFSSQENANRLASEFKAKGYSSEVFMKGELHTVSIQSYATSEEANANLGKLQGLAPGAWIYFKR